MDDIVIASTEADAHAAEAVEQHHAQLAGELAHRVEVLVAAASAQDGALTAAATAELAGWCERELVPHAQAEETSLYGAARDKPEARLLIEGMLAEHELITGLVRSLTTTPDPVRTAADARALQVLFESHLAKENQLVLPLLVADPGVSVAALLAGMHEILGGGREDTEQLTAPHSCGCGEQDAPGFPELDARAVPHAIRHATVFGALDAVQPGGGLVLVAPHDPLPLLKQVEQRSPGVFRVDYLERGPEAWRLSFSR
ncbi:MAG: DUF2249 domain-containing protein [Mycobacteriales bacterium]